MNLLPAVVPSLIRSDQELQCSNGLEGNSENHYPRLFDDHRETVIVTIARFDLANDALGIIARRGVIRQKHTGLVVILSIRPANMEVIARHRGLSGKNPLLHRL